MGGDTYLKYLLTSIQVHEHGDDGLTHHLTKIGTIEHGVGKLFNESEGTNYGKKDVSLV